MCTGGQSAMAKHNFWANFTLVFHLSLHFHVTFILYLFLSKPLNKHVGLIFQRWFRVSLRLVYTKISVFGLRFSICPLHTFLMHCQCVQTNFFLFFLFWHKSQDILVHLHVFLCLYMRFVAFHREKNAAVSSFVDCTDVNIPIGIQNENTLVFIWCEPALKVVLNRYSGSDTTIPECHACFSDHKGNFHIEILLHNMPRIWHMVVARSYWL